MDAHTQIKEHNKFYGQIWQSFGRSHHRYTGQSLGPAINYLVFRYVNVLVGRSIVKSVSYTSGLLFGRFLFGQSFIRPVFCLYRSWPRSNLVQLVRSQFLDWIVGSVRGVGPGPDCTFPSLLLRVESFPSLVAARVCFCCEFGCGFWG